MTELVDGESLCYTMCYHLLLVQNQDRDLNKGLKLSVLSAFKGT